MFYALFFSCTEIWGNLSQNQEIPKLKESRGYHHKQPSPLTDGRGRPETYFRATVGQYQSRTRIHSFPQSLFLRLESQADVKNEVQVYKEVPRPKSF
jgi:hypothetical protein